MNRHQLMRRLRATPSTAPVIGVPLALLAGAALNTWLRPALIGPLTTALGPHGALSYVALMLMAVGTQVRPQAVPRVAARVAVILAGATIVTGAAAILYGVLSGPAGIGGISMLALVPAAVCTSNAVWMALTLRFSADADDLTSGMIASAINSGPALPLLIFTVWDASHQHGAVDLTPMLDAIVPLLIGFIIGMISQTCRAGVRPALPLLLMIMSFDLGCQISLRTMAHQLLAGLGLGIGVAVTSGILVASGWTLILQRPATVGWAAGSIAVGAVLVPHIVAAADPRWAPYAAAATAQLGLAVFVSSLVALALTAWSWHRRHRHDPRVRHPQATHHLTRVEEGASPS